MSVISNGVGCDYYKFIWGNHAPPRVKFFGWLLVQNRIQSKENLLKKHCVESGLSELCGTHVESAAQLIARAQMPVRCWFLALHWNSSH